MRGAGWTYFAFFSRRIVTFLSTIVLARIVGPEGFGLMAMALLVLSYVDTVNDGGVGAALVQRQGDAEQIADVAFTIALITGATLTLTLFVCAPFVADFFGSPDLVNLLRFLSPIFLLSSFSNVQDNWLKRTFRFSARVIPEMSKALIKAAVSIALALAGFGVWSLAIGQMAGALAGAITYARAVRRKISLSWDRPIGLGLFGFGMQMSLITLLGVISETLDKLVVARALDAHSLGVYTIGALLPELVVMGFCTTASQVVFPAFSRIQGKSRLMSASFLTSLKFICALTFPVAVGIAIVAADFVTLVYTPVWLACIPIIQILAIGALVRALSFTAGDVFKALGRPTLLTWLTLGKIAISLPLLMLAVEHGLVAVAAAKLITGGLITVATLIVAQRVIGFRWAAFFGSFRAPFFATLVMALACVLLQMALANIAPALRLPLTIVVGLAVYALTLSYLDPSLLRAITRRKKPLKGA